MCGLVAIFDRSEINISHFTEMNEEVLHRGPDDSGLVIVRDNTFERIENIKKQNENFQTGFAFNRLSIQDLSKNASQPMISNNGRYLILLNGEIYNFIELRETLIESGHKFKSKSDTEVVLQMYEKYGEQMLDQLNGMFALVIYDIHDRSFFIARDRLGIKPLYYYHNQDLFIVASEIKSIIRHPKVKKEFNSDVLDEFLMFRYVSGKNTLFKNIYEVEPSQIIKFNNNGITKKIYWNINKENSALKGDIEELNEILRSSISYQLISDVEVGTQLSGGIDSSLISTLAFPSNKKYGKSFSVIPDIKQYSEEEFIDKVNNKLKLTSHKTSFQLEDIEKFTDKATWHFDQPLSQPNSIGIFLLSKMASSHLKVLLSGEGADEIFGGYDRYCAAKIIESYPNISLLYNSLRSKNKRDGSTQEEFLILLSATSKSRELKKLIPSFNYNRSIKNRLEMFDSSKNNSIFQNFLSYEIKTYLNELLLRQDKLCMANSIENRVPYLDHRLVEFAFNLSDKEKVSLPFLPFFYDASANTKKILKRYAMKFFDKKFIYRKKMGFSVPLNEFFDQKNRNDYFISVVEDLNKSNLMKDKLPENFLFDKNPYVSVNTKWTIYSFSRWAKIFFNGK